MSAFLGPIHHWMYNKIRLQEKLTMQLVNFSAGKGWIKEKEQVLNAAFDGPDTLPLEEIIDKTNIHGWLNARVERAEYQISLAIGQILEADDSRLGLLEDWFIAYGKECPIVQKGDASQIYTALDAVLLDGMPCDGGREILSECTDELVWTYDLNVHPHWKDVGRISNPYILLREALIRGMLEGTGFKLEGVGNATYKLTKE